MPVWIALFRGINVGGNRILPMKDLAALLRELDCADVKTYIQSGNAVFRNAETDASKLADRIAAAIEAGFGFAPRIMLLSRKALQEAASANPYPHAQADHKSLHLSFLAETPANPNRAALAALKSDTESYALEGQVFYLHAPDGIGRSRLAAAVERHLGVDATARNWRTVEALLELARELKE